MMPESKSEKTHYPQAAHAQGLERFALLWRQRRLFAAVFVGVIGLTVVAFVVLPVRYVAAGSIIVADPEPNTNAASAASAASAQKIGDPADLESQLLLVRSPRVVRLAMEVPGAFEAIIGECRHSGGLGHLFGSGAAACEKLRPDSQEVLTQIEQHATVATVGRSRVIKIGYESPLPAVAQSVANALITTFLDDQRASLAKSREVAASWLRQELRQLDAALRDDEARIQAYRRTKGLMRGATAPISSERLSSIGQQLSAAEAARAEAAARLQEISADPARGASDAPAVLSSRTVADLKQQLTTITAQLASSENVLGPNHPTLRSLQRERDSLKARLAQEIASIAASTKKTYQGAVTLVTTLQKQMDTAKAEVGAATDDEASISSMVRGAEIKRAQYADLYRRANELETEQRVLVGSTQLVSLAELPTTPFFPKRLPFLAAGSTLAFLMGAAAAFLRDRGRTHAGPPTDLAAMFGAPILAQLPQLKPKGAGSRVFAQQTRLPLALALSESRQDPLLQNALRHCYDRILRAGASRERSTILVTSAVRREGKTFTLLALAQVMAENGSSVLVVECDLRDPAFEAALQLEAAPGLSAVLAGRLEPWEAVVRTATRNLHAIPAGQATQDPAASLGSDHLHDLIVWAKRKYDFVLFDGPPVRELTDACRLAKQVDGVLCCSRWGHFDAASALAANADIRAAGGDVFGMAITMVKTEDGRLDDAGGAPAHAYIGAG